MFFFLDLLRFRISELLVVSEKICYNRDMTVIDDYLTAVDPEKRVQLERIRSIAKKIVPDAKETIGYGMPTLTFKGKAFLGFSVHKHHIGVYPYGGEEIEQLKHKLSSYSLSKGAIRVPFDQPIPEDILVELITLRLKRITR
jgi:uncharacterized protein YdhG (YjbR/CyaY superfamily)